MTNFLTINNTVACAPFTTSAVDLPKVTNSLMLLQPKTNLVPLEVKAKADLPSLGISLMPGDKIYVPAECRNMAYGKRVISLPDIGDFILVPIDQVLIASK